MLISKNTYTGLNKEEYGIQNVFTPIDEIENVTGFSFVNAIPANCKNICVLFNAEFVEYFLNQGYIKNNTVKIVFGYDSEFDLRLVKRLERIYKYNNMEYIDLTWFKSSKDIVEFTKIMGNRKFDVVFSNPPYNKNLDLKILKGIFNCAEHIVFVHPAGYLFDKNFNNNLYNEIRNTNYLEQVNFFFGNKMFDIGLFLPMCISVWNMNKRNNICKVIDNALWNETYNSIINNISFHKLSMQNDINNLKNIINKYNHIIDYRVDIPKSDWNIFISPIKGTKPEAAQTNNFGHLSYDLFTIVTKDINKSIVNKDFRFKKTFSNVAKFLWSFNTSVECNNCINYFKSKVVRFLLSYTKINQHMENNFDLIPWLDFTRSWNDKDLCKEFNISKELWQYIDKFIPDYYDDYKSGFETCRTVTKKVYDNPSKEMVEVCGEEIINEIVNKEFDMCWHSDVPNGAYVHFEKDNKRYSIQKSMNNNLNEKSKYRDRVGYELYELYR